VFRILLALGCSASVCCAPSGHAFGEESFATLAENSSIVFHGLVADVTASASGSSQSAIVKVEAVVDKPAAIILLPGTRVEVILLSSVGVVPGNKLLFFTNGRVFGESLVLQEVGHTNVKSESSGVPSSVFLAASDEVMRTREDIERAQLQKKVDSAQAIAVGVVREIRQPVPNPTLAPGGEVPPTEHDPETLEAVIEVLQPIKGAKAGETIIVRFPSSLDRRWSGYPKLKAGQTQTFVLSADMFQTPNMALLPSVSKFSLQSEGDIMAPDAAQVLKDLAQ
jgi:hypothetical protein